MRIRLISLLAIVLALLPAVGEAKGKAAPDTISARRAFVELPQSAIDLLPVDLRMDMLDYFDADSLLQATNPLMGVSVLKRLTPDFLEGKVTPSSLMQLKVLRQKGGGDIVMTIYTIGEAGDTQESDVRFYDASLIELPAQKFIKFPQLADFFDTKGYHTSMREIEDMIPYYSVVFEADPDNSGLTARLALGDILAVEDREIVSLLMKPGISYQWNGKQYK